MSGSEPDNHPGDAARILVANEQTKLSATYLNGLAIAIFAVGGLAPVVALVTGSPSATAFDQITSPR